MDDIFEGSYYDVAVYKLEPNVFRKHKDTLAYFNNNYVHTEILSKSWGRRIAKLEVIRH